ncbi:MAG: heparan-alpha-glucosaminide N-acetyltransferase domain-containing protein [Bacteroidia bacterium]
MDPKNRDHSIDIIRGFAILVMIPANFSPSLLPDPPPFWFRIFESLAAPLFVCISGYISSAYFTISLYKNIQRALFVLLAAAAVDFLIWQTTPFFSFDVLYVIGFCIPLHYLVRKWNSNYTLALAIVLMVTSPVMQFIFGYNEDLAYLNDIKDQPVHLIILRMVQSFFIDGWFPFLPWAGISMLGRFLFLNSEKKFIIHGALLTGISVILYFFFPSPWHLREGNSELFYPPGVVFLTFSTGFLFLIFSFKNAFDNSFFRHSKLFGRHSLAIYFLHLALAAYVLHRSDISGWYAYAIICVASIVFFYLFFFFYEKDIFKKLISKDQ